MYPACQSNGEEKRSWQPKTTAKARAKAKPRVGKTNTKAKREFNSLLHGKHDGKLVIENISPRLTAGKRKIIDETFKDTASYKETEDGEIKE